MTDNRKLLPCPFCGGEAQKSNEKRGKNYVECILCECKTGNYQQPETAVLAWNDRKGIPKSVPTLQWTKEPPNEKDIGKIFTMRYKDGVSCFLTGIIGYDDSGLGVENGITIGGWYINFMIDKSSEVEFLGPLPE